MQLTHGIPLSIVATYVGVAGLSMASVFGAFKFLTLWKQVRLSRYKADKEATAAQLASLRHALSASQALVREKEAKVGYLEEDVGNAKKRLEEVARELELSRVQTQTLVERGKSLATEVQWLNGETQRLNHDHAQTVELLQTRTAELKGAQAFLTKADHLSGADVIGLVEGLNSEIMQIAAFMAESFVSEEKMKRVIDTSEEESDELRDARGQATEVLGTNMVELLRTFQHQDDPILLQIAFQACMCAYTHWIISSWYFEDPEIEHVLNEIFARVREAEEQAVSGRWRALTRTHLHRMLGREPDMSMYMVDAFVNVLITAGYQEKPAALQDRIMNDFAGRIRVILQAAQRLNRSIGEGVTSCDLEALYIAPSVSYDPTTMEDAFNETTPKDKATTPEKVLCTTDLGLVRAEKVSGAVGEWQELVLLKPKVVLPSGLDDIVSVGE